MDADIAYYYLSYFSFLTIFILHMINLIQFSMTEYIIPKSIYNKYFDTGSIKKGFNVSLANFIIGFIILIILSINGYLTGESSDYLTNGYLIIAVMIIMWACLISTIVIGNYELKKGIENSNFKTILSEYKKLDQDTLKTTAKDKSVDKFTASTNNKINMSLLKEDYLNSYEYLSNLIDISFYLNCGSTGGIPVMFIIIFILSSV